MNTEYCFKCGGKAQFELQRPKFCPSCGEPFNQAVASNTNEEHQEDVQDNIPPTSSLKNMFKAEIGQAHRTTIGDLTPPDGEYNRDYHRPDNEPGLQGQDLLKKVMGECSKTKSSKAIGE